MYHLAPGTLYVVATPIGNLSDLSERARQVLAQADLVLAEDTRHSGQLLRQCGLSRPLESLHEHNERQKIESVVHRLQGGARVALVSDAGTPLVSDPGFPLLRRLRELDLPVVPVPGPCAAIAALSVAGLPTDSFVFEGFLPARHGPRQARARELAAEQRTLVFYESGKRLAETLDALCLALGGQRQAAVAREMTKLHETLYRGDLAALARQAAGDPDMSRGELVLVVEGRAAGQAGDDAARLEQVLSILLAELPLSQAVKLASRLTGARRNELYRHATRIQEGIDLT